MAADSAEGSSELPKVGVSLSTLPPALATKLEQYDTNGNGIIDPSELPGPLTTAAAPYISVSAFPKKLQPVLHELDDEKNGKLEMDELTEIFSTYAELKKANKEGSISIKALPKEIQSTLKAFDVDDDGTVAPLELARGAELYKQSKKTAKRLMIFAGVLMVFLCALVGVIVGLTAVVVEESKESKASGDGTLTKKGTSTPIAVGEAVKSSSIFDVVGMTPASLGGVKSLMLATGTTTRSFTVTGFTAKPGLVTFNTASGYAVVVSPKDYKIINIGADLVVATVTKTASARRRNLLATVPADTFIAGQTNLNGGETCADTTPIMCPDGTCQLTMTDCPEEEEECGDHVTEPTCTYSGICDWHADKNPAECTEKKAGAAAPAGEPVAVPRPPPGAAAPAGEPVAVAPPPAGTMQGCAAEKAALADAQAAKKAAEDQATAAKAALADAQAAKKAAEDKATTAEAAKKTAEDKATTAEAAKKTAEDALAAAKASATTQDKLTEAELRHRVKIWTLDQGAAIRAFGEMNDWDVSSVTDMSNLFSALQHPGISISIPDISRWDVSKVTDMSNMFRRAQFDGGDWNLNKWDTSKVTNMEAMFDGASAFNQPIGNWDVSQVKNMEDMFNGASAFNQDISGWKTAEVTDMKQMFDNARSFNQDISNWDTSKVTDMSLMFSGASAFNKPISGWKTSKVTDMGYMFYNARSFNQDISNWDTSKVTKMWGMFGGAEAFNQDISNWDTSRVTTMMGMFGGAKAFNQDISQWDTYKASMFDMFNGAEKSKCSVTGKKITCSS